MTIDLYDLNGKRVGTLPNPGLGAGEHRILLDLGALGLPLANYAYQVEVRNADGVFRTCRLMTAAR